MANPVIAALIADKIAQTSGADRITDTEVRDVLNALNAFIADNISYNTAIPFTCMNGKMAPHTVTGAITFTANTTNAIPWAGVGLRLTADGTNEPDFSDFKKTSTSEDYDNTNGTVNVVLFWYDGTDYWYSLYQEAAGSSLPALTVPGSFVATAASDTQIDLSWTDTNSSPNETNLKIYRNTVNVFGSATLISTKSADSTTHSDTGLTASTTYYYWLLAGGDGVTTDDSTTASTSETTDAAGGFDIFTDYAWTSMYDSDTDVTLSGSPASDGGQVDVWVDQAAGYDLAQAISANQPTYRATGINSKPAIEMNYTGGNYKSLGTSSHTAITTPFCYYFIAQMVTIPGSYALLISGTSDFNAYIHGGSGDFLAVHAGGGVPDTSYALTTTPVVIGIHWNGDGTADVYANENLVGSALSVGANTSLTLTQLGTPGSGCANFKMRHLFIGPIPDAGERADIIDWLKTDAGL